MHTSRLIAGTAAMLCCAFAQADSNLDRLDELMQGKFEAVDPERPFTDQRFRINAPELGNYVYYYQINSGPEMKVYRQRILIVTLNDSGLPSQDALVLTDPDAYAGASPDAFSGFGDDDVESFMPEGCEQVWTPTEDGFKGYVDPTTCVIISSRSGKPRGIEAEVVLDAERMLSAERGYDENGEQLFGTEPGEFLELRRVSE